MVHTPKLCVALFLFLFTTCDDWSSQKTYEEPEGWSISVNSELEEVQVGEDFLVGIKVRHPSESDFVIPTALSFEPLEVLETLEEKLTPVETHVYFRVAAYTLPRDLEIGPFKIEYLDGSGEMSELTTEPMLLTVVSSLTQDVKDIHDIKEPIGLRLPRDEVLFWWFLILVGFIVFGYIIYRWSKKDSVNDRATGWFPPPLPPDLEAKSALERLAAKRLIEQGQLTLFYAELSEIAKRYAGRHYEVPYVEKTTAEFICDLNLKQAVQSSVQELLEISDLVKFAQQTPGRKEAEKAFLMVESLIGDTVVENTSENIQ